MFFSVTSANDLLIPSQSDDKRSNPELGCMVFSIAKSVEARDCEGGARFLVGGRRADAGDRRGSLACVEMRYAQHLAASRVAEAPAASVEISVQK